MRYKTMYIIIHYTRPARRAISNICAIDSPLIQSPVWTNNFHKIKPKRKASKCVYVNKILYLIVIIYVIHFYIG